MPNTGAVTRVPLGPRMKREVGVEVEVESQQSQQMEECCVRHARVWRWGRYASAPFLARVTRLWCWRHYDARSPC